MVGLLKNTGEFFFYLSSLLLIFSLNSCSKSGSESQVEKQIAEELPEPVNFDLEQILQRGTLKAIVDNSSTSYFLYKGQPMGYEYELLEKLADEMDVELDLIITPSINSAFEKLNYGEGDIIAYSLTITKDRKEKVAFTKSHYTVRQVLVQRKPENWRKMKIHEIERQLIRNQVELIGKKVHVRASSSYLDRLQHLSEEIGGDIIIVEETEEADTESLIKKVATGEIEFTIADENVALVNSVYYPDLDIKTPVSFPQRIAWAVRKNAPELLKYINNWINKMKKGPVYNMTYNKYFRSPRSHVRRVQSDFSSLSGNSISEFDEIIKKAADTIGWDWKLIASLIYQESKFDPKARSWANAHGLMQLVPETASKFGAVNLYNPVENIKAGVNYLIYLDELWSDRIADPGERIKFVLASYNVGPGHIIDARALASKYGKDPSKWEDNVEYYLLQKTKPKYFEDPVVQAGYCRGDEPVKYVREVLKRYEQYKELMSS